MVCKVYFDIDNVDMNRLIEASYKYCVDICFGEDCVYMHEDIHHMGSISKLMKEVNSENYYLKNIPNRPDKVPEDLVTVWVIEKMDHDALMIEEDKKQESMRTMLDNISKAKNVFLEMVEMAKNKNKNKNGGRGDG